MKKKKREKEQQIQPIKFMISTNTQLDWFIKLSQGNHLDHKIPIKAKIKKQKSHHLKHFRIIN